MKIDFATFCHAGDAHRLHAPGQLKRQVESNGYQFDNVYVVYQLHKKYDDDNFSQRSVSSWDGMAILVNLIAVNNLDKILRAFGINLTGQYASNDQAHAWKNHVVNHLAAIQNSTADYIVFADNDCWMVRQPLTFDGFGLDKPRFLSWVDYGIEILEKQPDIFIISPNDGEPERKTQRMSQQMFLVKVDDFRNADFNQPGWDGNVNVPGGPMPEYWAMLEGRMELHCRAAGQYRYVLGPEYRYWHFNRLSDDGHFETDMSKY